jgi:hypothetical protein
MKKVRATEGELQEFGRFLAGMNGELAEFVAAASKAGLTLDYSLSSLESLEAHISRELAGGVDREVVEDRAARYLGELFRKNSGGRWELCLKDPKYLYFKLPVISEYASCAIEFCPLEVIRNFIHSKKKGLLREAVETDLDYKK